MGNDRADPQAILIEYDLGAVETISEAGGTAGRTWKVTKSSGVYQ